jgi:cytosine/adenosine deaminase-related metal-dependent hydrolase
MSKTQRHRFMAHRAVIENNTIISPAVIDVENGVITKISPYIPSQNRGNSIGLKDIFLFPGFINAHCHLELTALGPIPGPHFVPWIQKITTLLPTLDSTQIQAGIQNGIKQLLKSGVTTVFDHVSPHTPLSYFQNHSIDIISFGEVLGINLDKAMHSYAQGQETKKNHASFFITPHAIHSVHPQILKSVFSKEQGPFSIHIAESDEERSYFEKNAGELFDFMTNLSPEATHDTPSGISWVDQNGPQKISALWVHGNFLNDSDLNWLQKQENPCVVHCPGSWSHFRHDIFPKDEMAKRGITIALGTDSLASNTDLNILLEAQRYLEKFPETSFQDILAMMTVNAAQAIGFSDIGEIKEGQKAHFIGFKSLDSQPLDLIKTRTHVDFLWKDSQKRLTYI